ncbi:MAG: tRNA1(Val) (adenine(37)-N6)-methyltransferase [Alphaproteobacteria bacterium]
MLDAGCGAGAVFLCLAARIAGLQLTGLDVDPEVLALAAENARSNDLDVALFERDVTNVDVETLGGRQFDHVVANPPFWSSDQARESPDESRRRANIMAPDMLEKWIAACGRLLKHRGQMSLILPAERFDVALAASVRHLGSISILPVWPKAGMPARRVILQAIKGGRSPARLFSGLVLHDDTGGYSAAAQAVLTDAVSVWDIG